MGLLFGAPIGLVAIAPSAVSAPVLFAAAGAGRSVGDVSGRTLLQRISPNDVLSRVFGVLEGLTMLALVIGSVGAAILIEAYGVQAALVVVGAFLPVVILLSSGRLCRSTDPPRRPTPSAFASCETSPSSRRCRLRRWSASLPICSRSRCRTEPC